MNRELGIARCGLACCLCSEADVCSGCRDGGCRKGLLAKVKPRGFSLFARHFGVRMLLDRLDRKERVGVVYHRTGVEGDYDEFDHVEGLISFLLDDLGR